MKNKKEKLVLFFVGLILAGLWVWDLFGFFSLEKVLDGVKAGYLALGWLVWLPFVLSLTGIFDSNNGEYGKHSCDFCGGKIKIGKGKHWPYKDGCKCACEKCLPTVDPKNI
jgi:hypothetical protein